MHALVNIGELMIQPNIATYIDSGNLLLVVYSFHLFTLSILL